MFFLKILYIIDMMKNVLMFVLLNIIFCSAVNAASVVYPKTNEVKINSPVTFFIGNENPQNKLKINNEEVKIHNSGGFYHVVNLNLGKNIFTIDNGNPAEKKTYIITRPNILGSIVNNYACQYNLS